MNGDRIFDALLHTKEKKIAVFGDYCLDKYVYSDPKNDDISVETGEKAYQIYEKVCSAGAAGTITNNLCALGANVISVGAVGDDGEGFDLLKALRMRGADTKYMVVSEKICTATYLKTMRLNESGVYEEKTRLDFRNRTFGSPELWDVLTANFEKALLECDGAIVSDQFYERNSGAVGDSVRSAISAIAKKYPEKVILVDSRSFASEFTDLFVKCNNYELMKYCNMTGDPENDDDVVRCGWDLSDRTGKNVFITRNVKGILIFDREKRAVSAVPAIRIDGPIDVTGAGDASNAAIALALSLGLDCTEAAILACAVSSVTIEQLGTTGTSTPEQASGRVKVILDIINRKI